jgi:carbon-monoxide dehydrogenase medium subunit
MFPAEVDYVRADDVPAAREHLASADDAALLAGGHGLLPAMKAGEAAPDLLVDVSDVDALAGRAVDADGARVGAVTTHAELLDDDGLAEHVPVLPATAEHLADRQIRNRGTVGGNLAEAAPAADLPAAVLAAGGTVHVDGPDSERAVAAPDFFAGDGDTVLGAGDVVTAVEVPAHGAAAYRKRTHPASGWATVGVAVAADLGGEGDDATGEDVPTVEDPGVAVAGVTDRQQRLGAVEAALAGERATPATLSAAAERSSDSLDGPLRGDHHVSGEHRRDVLPTVVERALGAAFGVPEVAR